MASSDFPDLDWDQDFSFPDPSEADEDGLVGAGGNLSPGMLLSAYRRGLFPWFSREGVPYWFCPDPRFVLVPTELHIGATLQKVLKRRPFEVTLDQAFSEVIQQCSLAHRPGQGGTWISPDFIAAYTTLHVLGFAHSVEVWRGTGTDRVLVGGLYGIFLDKVFFGESMFSRESNASKVGFATLVKFLVERFGAELIDCQAPTAYLKSFGAREVAREWFLGELQRLVHFPEGRGSWESFPTAASEATASF